MRSRLRSSKRQHIVRRQIVELNVGAERLGQECLQSLRSSLQPMLMACLERVLADYDPDDGQVLQLQRLHLDLGTLPASSLTHELPGLIETALRQALKSAAQEARLPALTQVQSPEGAVRVRPLATQALDAWAHFFRNGNWPWWHPAPAEYAPADDITWLLRALEAAGGAADLHACFRFLQAVGQERFLKVWEHFGLAGAYPALEQFWRGVAPMLPTAPHRLHLPGLVLRQALAGGAEGAARVAEVLALVLAWLPAQSQAFTQVWEVADARRRAGKASAVASDEVGRLAGLFDRLAADLPGLDWPAADARPTAVLPAKGPRPRFLQAADEPLYVENAGLVLLHPFLPPLFEGLGLVEADAFADEAAAAYAALLLHHLVFGEAPLDESALALNKVLCGLPPSDFVDITQAVPSAHQVELEELLAAVCGHWEALRHAAPDDLRQTFLQRSGKLHLSDGRAELVVERKTVDLLVDRLPWAISLVRLPWMGEMLEVRW